MTFRLRGGTAATRRLLIIALMVVVLGVAMGLSAVSAAPGQRVDLKVLLLTDTGSEPSLEAWKATLDREGVPYDVIPSSATITSATLTAAPDHAKYQGVVVATSAAWAALSPAEQSAITTFERTFGIRQLSAFAFPSASYGLNTPTFSGEMGGTQASLTAAGLAAFPYLKGPVTIDSGSYGYRATPADPGFVTLVGGPDGSALVGVHTTDGREELVMTVDGNQFQTQSLVLGHGLVGWLTRGVYLGYYRQYLELQVDDIFYDNDRWDPVNNTTHEDNGATLPLIRMLPADVDRALAWSAATGIDLHMVFNGFGSDLYGPADPLSERLLAHKNDFYWINHTYEHLNLNTVSYATIVDEITKNIEWAALSGLPINPAELVTGEHSGLARPGIPQNPQMAAALTATGIRWIADDNSINPTQYAVGSARTVPRYPANIFYNTATQLEQLDEYNYIFYETCGSPPGSGGPGCIPAPVDWAGYVDNEATIMFRHATINDPRPHYVHQSNLAEEGVLYDVVNEVLGRTNRFFSVPLVQLTHTDIGVMLGFQQSWATLKNSGQVTAYLLDGRVYLTSTVNATVPLTGATGDLYGGLRSNWFDLSAGVTRVLPTPDAVNAAPSFIKGADQTVAQDAGPQTVAGWATAISAGPNDWDQSVSFSVVGNTNPTLFSSGPSISPTGTLTYTPAPDRKGSATITIILRDSGGTANGGIDTSDPQTFSIIATAVLSKTLKVDTVGLVDISQGRWYLRNSGGAITSFFYGNPGDLPISGDWDGNGTSTPGLYRQSDGFFYARDSNTQGPANAECFAGDPSDIPVVGDWDGDGDDNLGIYRPSEQKFYLFTSTCTGSPMGAAQISFFFGNPGDKPVAGDWDGDGIDEVGLHRESTGFFYWRNTLDTGIASGQIFFGDPGDRFVSGDWGIVDGTDTPAVFRPTGITFFFRHTLTQGNADSQFVWSGAGGWLPVAGTFGLG